MSSPNKITISPALPSDLHTIAVLECLTFYDEPFSSVAFGPRRDSEANIALRAKGLAKKDHGRRSRVIKAVNKEGEIVGMAQWGLSVGEGKGGEGKDGEEEDVVEDKGEGGVGQSWGDGANVRFCEDAFLRADEIMSRSCEGKAFAKLNALAIHPKYQRMGIGTMLLEEGLKEVDQAGLQCVLAASESGLGLYKKYGFEVTKILYLKLWEYEGGEGFGTDEHVVMHRPAVKVI